MVQSSGISAQTRHGLFFCLSPVAMLGFFSILLLHGCKVAAAAPDTSHTTVLKLRRCKEVRQKKVSWNLSLPLADVPSHVSVVGPSHMPILEAISTEGWGAGPRTSPQGRSRSTRLNMLQNPRVLPVREGGWPCVPSTLPAAFADGCPRLWGEGQDFAKGWKALL